MGSFEANYDEEALRSFTEEERAQLRHLHQQLDDKFGEIASFLARQLGFADTDPRAREKAEEIIDRWEEEEHSRAVDGIAHDDAPVIEDNPTNALQRLLSDHHSLSESIMDIRDEAIEREELPYL